MDIITSLSRGTFKLFKVDKIIDIFDLNDFEKVERWIWKFRKKEVKITKYKVRELAQNGITLAWSELIKCAIVLTIAYFLNIFIATFFIMSVFSSLRGLAGGVHMSTFNKCFAVMIGFFLTLGYMVSRIHINTSTLALGLLLGCIWSIIVAYKHAPQERSDKSDKDCDNGNKMKHRTIGFIIISFIISMMAILFTKQYIISVSIFTGVLLEMFTITPIGTRLFKWIDGERK